MSKPVAPECRESLDGIGHEYPTPVDFSRNMQGEPRLWSVILPRSESGQLFYARAVKTPMCAALRTFATDRVTYIFAKQN